MHIFTYGSLMFSPVWQRVVRGDYASVAACLDDYARYAVRNAGYPGIVAAPGCAVRGMLYREVGPEDLAALDRFEGAEYARVTVTVTCEDGTLAEAETYVYLLPQNLADVPWDPARFDLAAFVGEYCR